MGKDFQVQPKSKRLCLRRWWCQGKMHRKNIPSVIYFCLRIVLMFALVTGKRQRGVKIIREVYYYYYARKNKVTGHFICQLQS